MNMLLVRLITKTLSDMVFILLLLILSLGLGRKIWRILFDSSSVPVDIVEEGIFCTALGFGMFSLLILGIGLAGYLYFWVMLSLVIILFIISFKEIKEYIQAFSHLFRTNCCAFLRSGPFIALSPFVMVALIWLFLMSRVPPVFYDALVYHLGVPNQYLVHHAIRFMPYAFHSHHPFSIHMLFILCLLLGGQGTVKLFLVACMILNAVSLSLLAFRAWGRPSAWLAGAFFLLTPTILLVGPLVNVDLGVSLFVLLSLYAICMFAKSAMKGWLIIAAMMAGFSMGTKYTAILFSFGLCIVCLLFILIQEWRGIGSAARAVSLFTLVALVVASPWYIKNLVWTGNPFYPQWADVWGNPQISETRLAAFHDEAHAYNPHDPTRNSILLIPWHLVSHPDWFGAGGNVGPLFLLVLLLACIPERKNRLYALLTTYAILYYISWAFTFRMARFALPLFGIIFVLATNSLGRLLQGKGRLLRSILIIALMCGFSYNLYYSATTFSHVFDPWRFLAGRESENAYLSRLIPSYPALQYINAHLPPDARILFLGETRSYYCFREVIASTAHDVNPLIPVLKHARTREELSVGLKGMGITHLLINFPELGRLESSFKTYSLTGRDRELLADMVRSSTVLFRRGGIIVMEI